MVQSLVIESEGDRFVIITMDLLAIDFDEAENMRRRVIALGFQPQNILLAASHTHCSPASIDFANVKKNADLGNELASKAERAVNESIQTLATANVRIGFTKFPHNINRRQRTWFGGTKLGVDPQGPVDHQLASLLIETDKGKVLLVAYGCHPVIAKAIPKASSDYIAGIRQASSSLDIRAVLFLNGALGDIVPYDRDLNRPLSETEYSTALDFGSRIARECIASLSQERAIECPSVHSKTTTVTTSLPKLAGGTIERKLPVQALTIDRFVSMAFPGEIFAQTSLNMRRTTAIENLVTISCANGYIGYVAPMKEYPRGGYEIKYAPKVFGYLCSNRHSRKSPNCGRRDT